MRRLGLFQTDNGKVMTIVLASRDPLSSNFSPGGEFFEIEKGIAINVSVDTSDKRSRSKGQGLPIDFRATNDHDTVSTVNKRLAFCKINSLLYGRRDRHA